MPSTAASGSASAVGSPSSMATNDACRCVPPSAVPMCDVADRTTSRIAGRPRCTACSSMRRTGAPSTTVASEPRSSGRPPRNPLLATSGSPNATTATPRRANAPSNAAVASVASCASSTTISRSPARVPSAADAAASVVLRSTIAAAKAPSSAESNWLGRTCSFTSAYSSRKAAAATHSGRSARSPSPASAGASTPCSTARIMRSRSSERNPRRRPHLGHERLGPRGPEPVADAALEEVADDLVVLRAGEQGDRGAGGGTDELEGDRVRGARERTARRDAEPHGQLVAQSGRRRTRRREHEHLVGAVAAPFDAVGDELDDEPRLAASGCSEDRGVLAVCERRDGVREGRGAGHA